MKPVMVLKCLLVFVVMESCTARNQSANTTDNDIDTSLFLKPLTADTFPTGKLINSITCRADTAQSYALYIPAKAKDSVLPIVYFFDPHGDGSLPLNKYKSLAETYGFILAGSNNSKNGNDWSTEEHIWAVLSDDTQKRLTINKARIYTCGFSGGAKGATYFALHHPGIKGVIANGAGLPEITQAGNFNFSFTAIAGEGDMNRSDLIAINSDLDKTQARHRIIFFDGIHEWAPENTMNIAFAGLQLDAMSDKIIPDDTAFINDYISSSKKRIDGFFKTNNFIRVEEECVLSISMLNGLTADVNWFKEKDIAIKKNAGYQKQSGVNQELLLKEQNIKAGYQQQFQQADMNYWVKTISDVSTKAKSPGSEGAMYKRLKAYLSLAFYSISKQYINSKQDAAAQHFVSLYKMADPANSEAWYFSAILNARNNNANATRDDLLKAITNGFNDKARLMQQPEFQHAGISVYLKEMESKMRQ